jgi:hypothetical protein
MNPIPTLGDAAFLNLNPRSTDYLRLRHPTRSDADLARALRLTQWLLEPAEKLREPEFASYLLSLTPNVSGPQAPATALLW